MKVRPIDPYAARDIQAQVAKVHRGLDGVRLPIDLREVRELLRLDRRYYSSTNTGALSELGNKVKVGAKQILLRPTLVLDVIRKAGLRALWVPDRKRILIDEDLPDLKKRHAEAHEITHGITPHHSVFLLGDDEATLRHSCYEKIEAEANFGSGQLLFPHARFQEELHDMPRTIATVLGLAKVFGNTLTMTLWRVVENAHRDDAVFGVVSVHPGRFDPVDDATAACQYFIESPAFRLQYANVIESEVFAKMCGYCSRARGGLLGEADVILTDRNGDDHWFHLATFFNGHQALTLGTYVSKAAALVVAT